MNTDLNGTTRLFREAHDIGMLFRDYPLVSADGSYSTYAKNPSEAEPVKTHLDELSTCIAHLEEQNFDKPLVHIIDREGDSVGHIRRWQKAGSRWLVRAKDNPRVEYAGQTMGCKQVAKQLKFKPTRMVVYHGKPAQQWNGWQKLLFC